MRIELHPEARAELRAASLWYDERRPGLGDDFVADVVATLERVAATPRAFPVWPEVDASRTRMHRAVIERFGHVVAFEIHEDHIMVLAIAHGRRRPLYWLSRAD